MTVWCVRERRKATGFSKKNSWRKKMRKWFAMMVVGACISLPVVAQEKDADSKETTTSAPAPKVNLNAASSPSVSKSPWALPAQPRTTPFPGPADTKKSAGDDAPGQLWPKYELAGGYSYVNFDPGDPFNSFGSHGGTASFAYNPLRYLGLTAEFGGYSFKRNLNGNSVNGSFTTLMAGPRLNLRKFDHFVPFAEFLFGATNSGIEMTGTNSQSVFSMATGGGVDVVITKNLAWR